LRRPEKEIKDQAIIDDIIGRAQTCYLSMVDGDKPYVIPVNFGMIDNVLYIHSAPEGRKLEIIMKNPKVSVLFDVDQEVVDKGAKACNWSTKYRSVIGFGQAEIIIDDQEKIEGLDAIMNHYSQQDYEYNSKSVSACIIIRITLDRITGKSSGY